MHNFTGSKFQPPKCTYTVGGSGDDLADDLQTVLNPRDDTCIDFCMYFIEISNKISKNDLLERFLDRNKIRATQASELCSELLQVFSWPSLRDITSYDLLSSLRNKMSCQTFETHMTQLGEIFLRHHDCASCKTLVHQMHEIDYQNQCPTTCKPEYVDSESSASQSSASHSTLSDSLSEQSACWT